jgi:hypothetical protein
MSILSVKQTVPLVIRGRIIEDDLVAFGGRGGAVEFETPEPYRYLRQLPLTDPNALSDVHQLKVAEIIDFLVAVGANLDIATNAHLQRAREFSYQTAPTTASIIDAQYEALKAVFDRDVLEAIVETEITPAELEGWVSRTLRDGRRIAVRGFGCRSVHIVAGNSPVVSALSMIRNALTRGDAIIKSPSNDPYTAVAVARTMADLDAHHPLTRHISVAYWRGGDKGFEKEFYQPHNLDKIVAWGGFSSVKHITQYLQPGLELISFDPKRSASVIGRDTFESDDRMSEAAQRLAIDVGQLNQVACASARVVYAISGTDGQGVERANHLGELTYRALLELPPSISTAPRAASPALWAEVDALRLQEDWYRVIGGQARQGAIIVSQTSEPVTFANVLNDRVANIVPVDSVGDIVKYIDGYTQTVGIYPESIKSEVRDALALAGAQRIVSLGYACAPSVGSPHDSMEPLRRLCRWVADEEWQPEVAS